MTLQSPIHEDVPLPVSTEEPEEGSRWGKAHHILLTFFVLAIVAWLLSGFYTVNADEVAIIERLGQYQTASAGGPVATVEHGLHYRLPWPIDRVHKIPVQRRSTLAIRTFNEPPDAYADFKRKLQQQYWKPEVISALFDPYLITGDKNVVHMEIAVEYRIDDAEGWLNTVAHDESELGEGNREEFLRRLIEHAMISQVARMKVDNILFEGSDRLPALLNAALGQQLDIPDPDDPTGKRKLSLGVRVVKVDVTAARPPTLVQPAFDQVFKARSERESAKIRAEADANGMVVNAQADQATQLQQAEAYRSQTVDAAKGEASRFSQIYEQYKVAPDITSWSVYVDAVKAVSSSATRLMIARPGQHVTMSIDPPTFDAAAAAPK
jgi:membrane protease subunit HflK